MSLRIVSEASRFTEPSPAQCEFVIHLDAVSVCYRVPQEPIRSLKEYAIRSVRRRIHRNEYWALSDVNLGVCFGEVFGIVGRNGAGKSTLLKVISRVLRPTKGRVRVHGMVAPLLELGAGFHPELSGRENVFLNGTLLGHSRRDVQTHFEQIEEFADIGDFIDAPLRTYSTGMMARLGFAVATAWRPDILILDEVLGVGDEAFQHKCQSHIQKYREQGTTVLLVSHNMNQVQQVCQRAIWLDQGTVQMLGTAGQVAQSYLQANA